MNSRCYRVIFNLLRNMMMVVAEHVKSHKVSSESVVEPAFTRSGFSQALAPAAVGTSLSVTLRPLVFSVMWGLGLVTIFPNPMNIHEAGAEAIAAGNVPGNQQPTILNAPNGIEVVNIQTPSAAGVSRNVYETLNVPTQGMIFNNARSNVQTQLGGWIQGNPWLATGSARIILNEVNSTNPSYLNGYMEVAGSRAEFIVANPNGISCNGCGFINTSRGVLTTGVPMMSGGDLTGYRVTGGTVSIIGNGLDASRSTYTDIIARAVEINAGIWANDLKITAGANEVNAANTKASVITASGAAPASGFALDVSALGGMYAGKIHMIGTEAGLGVRNAGVIYANSGSLSLDINGNLSNSNTLAGTTQTTLKAANISNTAAVITSAGQLDINAAQLSGDGTILAGGNTSITLTDDYTQTPGGTLQANGNLTLTTAGNIHNHSAILAGQTLTLNAQNLDNAVSGEISGLNTHIQLNLTSGTLTNRGLIDGSDTFIHTATLNNLGTGAIFGDHVAIAADSVNNLDETLADAATGISSTMAAVIGARNRLDIGARMINNRNNALIFSGGDMAIGGALDNNHHATTGAGQPQTETLNNHGAIIEALGTLDINAAQTTNTNANLVTHMVVASVDHIQEVQPEGWPQHDDVSHFPTIFNYGIEAQKYIADDGSVRYFEDYYFYDYKATTQVTQVISSQPAQILSGADMHINGNLTNDDSQIIAGGNLTQQGGTLANLTTPGIHEISYAGTVQFRDWDGDDEELEFGAKVPFNPATQTTTFNLGISRLENFSTPAGSAFQVTDNAILTIPNNALTQPSPDPTASYYLETNPRFASYKTWLSSDYMLTAMSYDPVMVTKRLGDGFYEQRLIREQINQLTGRRFLTGYANDEQQYQALMTNGATFAQQYQLIPGVDLTAAQIAQLTSDIVWLVEQTVTLADGTRVQALVPQIYLVPRAEDLQPTGALIAGQSIRLDLTQNAINQGSIAGRDIVQISADNIHNLGGNISGNITSLNAQQDINNQGGSMSAQDALILQAGHDINIQSTTQSSSNSAGASSFSRTNLDRVAGLYVSNPSGTGLLIASANNNITLQGAMISNSSEKGTTLIDAGNNLNLSTINTAEQNNAIQNSKNYIKHGSAQEIGTQIQTKGDITLNAGNDLTARAANVTSQQGNLTANAQNNLTIEAVKNTSNLSAARTTKKSGTFSSKKTERRDTFNDTEVISSTFSGNTVNLNAGNDLTVSGSNVVGTQDVNLNAQNNLSIEAAQSTHDETHYYKEKKSGFSASSTSIGFGTSKLTTTNNTQSVTNVGSTIGSVEGDVNINAGKQYKQSASDVLAPQRDINITAQNVDINSATDTYANQQSMKFKQSGVTLSISNPVISAAQTVNQMKQAAKDTSDSRMQALAAGTSALAINNSANAINSIDQYGNVATAGNTGANDLSNVTQANAADQVGGINISLSIGSSKSKSSSQQTINTAKGSTLNAGGDINIAATGDTAQPSNPNNGNINVIGSQLKAKDDITLTAQNDINLKAATNTSKLDSKNKSSSASVGVSVNLGAAGGVGVAAGLSSGKGKTTGNGTTWTETTIQGGNQQGDTVTLNSSADTTLKGAQVIGNQVQANVGISGTGNLNIQSLQDTDQYQDKQSNTGISVTVPLTGTNWGGYINSSNSKTNSNYQSVNEQAGIFAGDEGFQITTNGNTNLKGAVIASTDKAANTVDENGNPINRLTTQTLTTSNIDNKVAYEAKASSATVGGGLQAGLTQLSGAGIGKDEGKAGSSTVSAVSGGEVNVTEGDISKTQLSRDVQTSTDSQGNLIAVDSQGNNLAATVTPIFDAEKVAKEINAQVQITEAFGQQAYQAVGNYVQEKRQHLQTQLKSAVNPEDKIALQGQLNELRLEEQVMNVLIGAVTGLGGTALTKEFLSAAAEEMRRITIENSLLFKGITDGTTVLNNTSGESEGVRGDGIKGGGTRVDLDNICGPDNARCVTRIDDNGNNVLVLKDGMVQWRSKNEISLAAFLESPEGQKASGATGGIQGWIGTLFGKEYQPGSWQDKLIEAFGGTHDYVGGQVTGLYDEQGNTKRGMDGTERFIRDRVSELAILPSAPFAMSELLPAEVWTAISILLKGAK